MAITLRATSTTDNTLFGQAQGAISLSSLTITPPLAKIAPNTPQQFTTSFTNFSGDQNVVWSVNSIGGGTTQTGTITPAGLYIAPLLREGQYLLDVIVRATNISQPDLFNDVKVVITPGSLTISPATATLVPLQVQEFTATYQTFGGSHAIIWSVNGIVGGNSDVGTIFSFGEFSQVAQYTAPLELSGGSTLNVTITATNPLFPDLYSDAQVTGQYNSFLLLNPSNISLETNQTQQFSVTFHNFGAHRRVTWTLQDLSGGNNDIGTITADGLYTAPAQINQQLSIGVLATSVADPSLFTSTQITLLATNLSINPGSASLDFSQTQQFSTLFTSYTDDQTVVWAVDDIVGGNSDVGTIDANGLYTAPAQLPPGQTTANFAITATSVALPTLVGRAGVIVPPGINSTMPPTPANERQ